MSLHDKSCKEVDKMRRGLRYGIVASGLAAMSLVPVGVASAASVTGTSPGPGTCTGDQQRLHLRDGTGGRALHGAVAPRASAAVPGGYHHASGPTDGTRTGVRPLDGTGSQWHWLR